MARSFYSNFCQTLVETSSPEVAETAKLFENTFRQVNIALVNELAQITRAMGINVHEVVAAASTKPYGFMKFNPGLGVGGHCIPVDPSYLAYVSEKHGVESKFIELANQVNLEMPSKVVERIKDENGSDLRKKRILIVGMSYKSNVADVRESPSIQLLNLLRSESKFVEWFDPIVSELNGERSYNGKDFEFDIAIIAVSHNAANLQNLQSKIPYILDCTGTLNYARPL
jgi:UDP-N-acetyl-D-glucosamine dehydrogenase